MNLKAIIYIFIVVSLSACGHFGAKSGLESGTVSTANDTLENSTDNLPAEPSAPPPVVLETIPVPQGTSEQPANVDLLERMRNGFSFPQLKSKYIAEYERWDATHPTYLNNLFKRSEPYLYYIVEEIEKRGLPMELALLPAIESAYKPGAVSRSGAAGLWQFIPSTGRGFGLRQDWWYDGRRDVIASTQAALDYLTQLNQMFDGDWFLTLAAYNAGPGTVSRAIKSNKRKRRGTDYTDLKLRSETRRYVPKLIALKNIINNPKKYKLTLPSLASEAHFEVIELPGQIDLHSFANNAQLSKKTLDRLNPGFKRWATPPQGPHRLLVPVGNLANVQAAANMVQKSPRIEYRNHRISNGDTLSGIARRYGVTVSALQTSNNLRGSQIRAGKNLMIPIRGGNVSPAVSSSGNQERLVHRVKRGDTLWSIARRYKVQLKELASWNKLSMNQILRLDQALTVFVN